MSQSCEVWGLEESGSVAIYPIADSALWTECLNECQDIGDFADRFQAIYDLYKERGGKLSGSVRYEYVSNNSDYRRKKVGRRVHRKSSPITPDEAEDHRLTKIPAEVYEAFNDLIRLEWNGRQAVVEDSKVLGLIVSRLAAHGQSLNASSIQKLGWLDIEGHYREAGWCVVHHISRVGDNYTPNTYTFTRQEDGVSH